MEHIDEGTIHAWLDAALPDADAARVEAHVAECAACAAAVAEARGLIAASSRILSALDDVPGGVIPAKVRTVQSAAASVAQTSAPPNRALAQRDEPVSRAGDVAAGAPAVRGVRPPARRPWYRRPQWAAAAGISFLAVAASAVWQRSGAPTVMEVARARARATPILAPDVPGEADSVARSADDALAAAAPVAPRQSAGDAANAPSRLAQSNEMKRAIAAEAAPLPAAPPMSVRPSPAAVSRAKVANDTSAAARPLALNADAITRSEGARVAGERGAQRKASVPVIGSVVVTGAAAANTPAPPRGATEGRRDEALAPRVSVASIAACYRLQPTDGARALDVGELLQLEDVAAGSDEARPAYVARDLTATPAAVVAAAKAEEAPLRWTLSTSGQVTLVRGTEEGAQRLTLELRAASRETVQFGPLQATRTPCPSR